MQIKKKLQIGTFLSLVLVLIAGFTLLWRFQEIRVSTEKEAIANKLAQELFELRILFTDLILFETERARVQWLSKHDSIAQLITSEKFTTPQEKALIEDLAQHHKESGEIFSKIMVLKEEFDGNIASQELEKSLREQLSSKAQVSSNIAFTLVGINNAQVSLSQQKVGLSVIGILAAMMILVVVISLLIWKRIGKPIAELKKGTDLIGGGDLDYQIEVKSDDEIGQLSHSFNQMAIKLMAADQQLRASNQQLDATTQQLRAGNQQLIAAEKILKEKIRELEVFNKAMIGRELQMIELKKELEALRTIHKKSL